MAGLPKGNITSTGMGVCVHGPAPLTIMVSFPAGATTVLSEGSPTLNAGSVGNSSCGHSATPSLFSATVLEEGMGTHRMGDIGLVPGGIYTLMAGAPTVMAG